MTGPDHGSRNDDNRRNERFVRDVLDRTSGSACDRACGQLSDLLDGSLQGLDRELVQVHLEHCRQCRALAVTLGWLEPLLPRMAEVDPGPDFTALVLARTTGRVRVKAAVPAVPGGAAGLMDRVGRWWGQQILRPYFAAQVAYAATVIMVLLTAVPGAPLQGVPGRALEIMQAGPAVPAVVGPVLDQASDWVGNRAGTAAAQARTDVGRRWRSAEHALVQRGQRTAPGRRELEIRVRATIGRAGGGRLGEASCEFLAALQAGRLIWNEWWNDSDDQGQP